MLCFMCCCCLFHVFCINHVPLFCAVAFTIFLFEQSLDCCLFYFVYLYDFGIYYWYSSGKNLMVNVVGIYFIRICLLIRSEY